MGLWLLGDIENGRQSVFLTLISLLKRVNNVNNVKGRH